MFDKKSNSSKLSLIILLFFLALLFISVIHKVALFSTSNKTDYLPEKLKNLELLYFFEYSETKSSFFYAFRLDNNIVYRIKKEDITYLQKK